MRIKTFVKIAACTIDQSFFTKTQMTKMTRPKADVCRVFLVASCLWWVHATPRRQHPLTSRKMWSPARTSGPPEVWAIVVQGPVYSQAVSTFGNDNLSRYPGLGPFIRVLSTWDEELSNPLVHDYADQGFRSIFSSLSNFTSHVAPGRGNVNLQIYTSSVGLALAKKLNASHALKIRGDISIENVRKFFEHIVPHNTPALSLLTTYNNLYPTVPYYPCDFMAAGPIDEVIKYFGPPFQTPEDTDMPELYLMKRYAMLKNWTSQGGPDIGRFCRSVDWMIHRTPVGAMSLHYRANPVPGDLVAGHTANFVDSCPISEFRG